MQMPYYFFNSNMMLNIDRFTTVNLVDVLLFYECISDAYWGGRPCRLYQGHTRLEVVHLYDQSGNKIF
jgi:hypothetical protein